MDKDDYFPLFFLGLITLLFVVMLLYIGVIVIHDFIYSEQTFKTESLFLDDVQYLDDGVVLYRFGDTIIKDRLISDVFQVNKYYGVVYVKYSNSWTHKDNEWKYFKIKEVENAN